MKWEKTGSEVSESGKTIKYEARGCAWRIESRQRNIPHCNEKPGTWSYTSYFACSGDTEKEFYRLSDAKKWVERQEGDE